MQRFRLIPALVVVLVAALGVATVRAADPVASAPVVVDPAFSQRSLEHNVDVLEDPTGGTDFDDVRNAGGFKPAPAVGTNFGFTRSAWWLRFTLSNPGDHDYEALVREDYPLIDYLGL